MSHDVSKVSPETTSLTFIISDNIRRYETPGGIITVVDNRVHDVGPATTGNGATPIHPPLVAPVCPINVSRMFNRSLEVRT